MAKYPLFFVLFGVLASASCFAEDCRLTSLEMSSSQVVVRATCRPQFQELDFPQKGLFCHELVFPKTILALPNRSSQGLSTTLRSVEVVQFSAHPDVVHIVLKQTITPHYHVVVEPLGQQYRLTITWSNAADNVPSSGQTRPFKVFLDVGHGGYDPGGTGPAGLPESFVNLDVAQRVAAILKRHGFSVAMDRTSDHFVSLPDRVKLADESHCQLFVGLYCNASRNRSMHGTTTYFYHPIAKKFAWHLCNVVARDLGLADNGAVFDNLYVIKHTLATFPAVIIEYAFISNFHEEALLADHHFRDKIAQAVAQAIMTYR